MFPLDFEFVADFFAEDPIERLGVLGFSISGWVVAVVNQPPPSLVHGLIQIIPPLLGIWVAHRSMERSHELRMEKLRSARRAQVPPTFPFDRTETSGPSEDTVDVQ